jgi:hypothetical protein
VADVPPIKRIISLVSDGTGRSEEEIELLVVTTVVSGLVAGIAAGYLALEQFREFLREG